MFAIRPIKLSTLDDKDSADAAGDIFFWIKDRILHPMRCRRQPDWNQCNTSGILETNDQVYAKCARPVLSALCSRARALPLLLSQTEGLGLLYG